MERANLGRVARRAARNETARNLGFVATAKDKVESSRRVLADHEAECRVAA